MEAVGGSGSEEVSCGRRQSEKQSGPPCYARLRALRPQGLAREGVRPSFDPPPTPAVAASQNRPRRCAVSAVRSDRLTGKTKNVTPPKAA